MKKLMTLIAVFAFLALGAGMARADHYHSRYRYPDRCDYPRTSYYDGYRTYSPNYYGGYNNYYRDSRLYTPVYPLPSYRVPAYDYSRYGIGVQTPNFSFYYRR